MANNSRGDGPFALLLLFILIGGVLTAWYRNAHPDPNRIKTEGGFINKDQQ